VIWRLIPLLFLYMYYNCRTVIKLSWVYCIAVNIALNSFYHVLVNKDEHHAVVSSVTHLSFSPTMQSVCQDGNCETLSINRYFTLTDSPVVLLAKYHRNVDYWRDGNRFFIASQWDYLGGALSASSCARAVGGPWETDQRTTTRRAGRLAAT